jgi:hypothetical protein
MDPQRPKVAQREPVPELTEPNPLPPRCRVRPLARLRVPLTLTVRPWATLYRLPDGRTLWCIRLPAHGVVVTRCVASHQLRTYARINGLAQMEHELDDALAGAGGEGDVEG